MERVKVGVNRPVQEDAVRHVGRIVNFQNLHYMVEKKLVMRTALLLVLVGAKKLALEVQKILAPNFLVAVALVVGDVVLGAAALVAAVVVVVLVELAVIIVVRPLVVQIV